MQRCSVFAGESGIIVRNGQATIALDPLREAESDFTFVSHAHTDHLHRAKRKTKTKRSQLLASRETLAIAQARGYSLPDSCDKWDGFELVDTGHILGSRGLLIGSNEVYYTGDISTRQRAFMKPGKTPHAHTLIIESTFGRPEYLFPSVLEVKHRTNKIISEMYDLGRPVILMGYALGKAQLLTTLFDHWDPMYLHDSVANMNSVYSELGIKFKEMITYSQAEKDGLLSGNKPWIMVAPLMSGKSAFVRQMKEKYGAVTIGFSGWAVGQRYRYMMGLDYAMPMSDHCDYQELVNAVKTCNPIRVLTFHGFSREFAKSLRGMGFDAASVDDAAQTSRQELPLDAFQ